MEETNDEIRHETKHKIKHNKHKVLTKPITVLLAVTVAVIMFNFLQIEALSLSINGAPTQSRGISLVSANKELANIDVSSLKSTGHTLAAVFPVEEIQTPEDAMRILFPTGTPEYGSELGVSYDEPVESLAILAKMHRGLLAEVKQNNPEGFQRYMSLASQPVGISCEYCCGLKTIGINNDGSSSCGCQHNPALLTVALYLSAYTDYNDGEILQEVMKWKILFFPKNMIELGMTVAGGDTSALDNLPGMVGGC